MNSNPYRITDLMQTIKDIAADCDDRFTQQRLDDLTVAEVKANAYDAGFKAGSVQHTTYGYQPLVKVVALAQHVIEDAMQWFPSKKINAIKEVRNCTGMGLKDSKDVVDSLFSQEMDRLHHDAQNIDYSYNYKS